MQITALTMPPFLTLAVHDHRAATLTCDDGNDNTQRPTDPCRNWCGGQGGRGRAGLSAVGNHTRDANTALLRRFRSRGQNATAPCNSGPPISWRRPAGRRRRRDGV
jgi:hypothetical protein